MLGKGQGATMATYDTLLLAFDKDQRVDEAESLWNMILHTHTRSISKWLFSRMISLYAHHDMPNKMIEVTRLGAPTIYIRFFLILNFMFLKIFLTSKSSRPFFSLSLVIYLFTYFSWEKKKKKNKHTIPYQLY